MSRLPPLALAVALAWAGAGLVGQAVAGGFATVEAGHAGGDVGVLAIEASGDRGATAHEAASQQQPAEHRAGLVVDFGHGTVRDFCVDLGGVERTGEELLRLAGMDIVAEYIGGTMVCRLDGVGCDYPGERCWCKCQDLGGDCTYWSYNFLRSGRWEYSRLGAHARVVRPGDVDGWAWGPGTVALGAQPPPRSFAEVCGAAAESTAVPSVPKPSAAPRFTPPPRPSATRRASATARTRGAPRGTVTAPAGAASTATSENAAAEAGTATAAARSVLAAQAPAPAAATIAAADQATANAHILATATAVAAALTALPWPTALGAVARTTSAAREPAIGDGSRTGDVPGAAMPPTLAPVEVVADGGAAVGAAGSSNGTGDGDGARNALGYTLFGLLALASGAVLAWLRRGSR